jgi:hypothetical protein
LYIMKNKLKIYLPLLLIVATIGCKKDYLETKPSNAVPEEVIFATTDAVASAMDGVYKALYPYAANGTTGHDNFGQKAVDLASDLMGNDMVVHQQGYNWFNRDYQYTEWQLPDATNRRPDIVWYYYYDIIKQVNKILVNLETATGPAADKESLKGQGLGLRAWAYYNLINLFQQTYKGNETKPGVPLYAGPALDGAPRGTVQDVYTQIITDLTEAETLLTGKVMPTKAMMSVHTVQGLRARTALVMEDWATAATYANKARQGYSLMSAAQYQAGFSDITNPEWIWGSDISADQATIYASFYSHIDVATQGYAALGGQKKITKALYDQIPAGDVRKTVFRTPGTGTSSLPDYNQTKFHVPTPGSWAADYIYMRAGEMYLIEAEALARQGQEAPARNVLETEVKARNAAYSAASFSGAALLNEILLQRRIELWGEGFSLIDIKRLKTGLNRPTGPGNHGAPNYDPAVYTLPDGDPKFIMKLPKRELDNNANMTAADQNP